MRINYPEMLDDLLVARELIKNAMADCMRQSPPHQIHSNVTAARVRLENITRHIDQETS